MFLQCVPSGMILIIEALPNKLFGLMTTKLNKYYYYHTVRCHAHLHDTAQL